MTLNATQQALCQGQGFDFSGLSGLLLNGTLKLSGILAHTETLLAVPRAILEASGAPCRCLGPNRGRPCGN